jgi:predicted esterase
MCRALLYLILFCAAGLAAAEVPALRVPVGEMVEDVACASDPTQTYTLYLPSGFTNERRWPVVLVFDPRGRSVLAAELFREAADDYGWIIVSSNDTRSDGPMEPNIKALNALWPEVHTRLPADNRRIYAAGFSGGAAVAYLLATSTGEVAGIIACGGRFLEDQIEGSEAPIFSTAGDTGFNYREMLQVDEFLAHGGRPHRLVIFEGSHSWMPPAVAREGVEWLELLAMQRGLRELDPTLVASLYADGVATAESLTSEGLEFEAARRYREIEETYDGVRDITAVGTLAESLEASPGYRRQQKEMKQARSFESRCQGERDRDMSALRFSENPPPVARLARDFEIADLQRRAQASSAMGLAAQRCLNGLYSGLSFYLPRDAVEEKRYSHAATSYELALMIRGDNPIVWYNLACVRALQNREGAAMEALQKALDLGFNRPDLFATDPDLDTLRDREDFKALLATRSDVRSRK